MTLAAQTAQPSDATDNPIPAVGDARLRHEVIVDGARLVYAEAGSGEPVVLLHGYPESRLAWRKQFGELARTHRVIAPDLFGWGESGRPLNLSFTYGEEVARLGRFLDAVGAPAANIVAHDYGAHLALGLAVREPRRVLRLAVLNSRAHRTFPWPAWLLFGTIGVTARTPLLSSLLHHSPLVAIHRLMMRRFLREGSFNRDQVSNYLAWMKTPVGRTWYVLFFQDYRLAEPADVVAGLPHVRIPAAIIWGERDPYCPAAIARDLAGLLPKATLKLLPDANHFVMEQRPTEVNTAIQALLARPFP